MGKSYYILWIDAVWATKNRQPLVKPEVKMRVFNLLFFLGFISIFGNAQNIDAYKYISVSPSFEKYQDIKIHGENVTTYENGKLFLEEMFRQEGFTVLPSHYVNWPQSALSNQSRILWCIPYDKSEKSFGMYLKDLNGEILLSELLTSNKRISRNLVNHAIQKCWGEVDKLSYNFDPSLKLKITPTDTEHTGETEALLKLYFDTTRLDAIEGVYMSEIATNVSYYKLGVKKVGKKYKVIVIESQFDNWEEGQLKAIFEESDKEDEYTAIWYSLFGDICKFEVEFKNGMELMIKPDTCETINRDGVIFFKTYPFK